MVHICKVISPGIFFFHLLIILILWVVSGRGGGGEGGGGFKRAKNSPKWQIIMSVVLHISGTMYHMVFIYGTHCKMIIFLGGFFIYSKF